MILGATRVLLKINNQTSWAGCKLKWIFDEINYQPNSSYFFSSLFIIINTMYTNNLYDLEELKPALNVQSDSFRAKVFI